METFSKIHCYVYLYTGETHKCASMLRGRPSREGEMKILQRGERAEGTRSGGSRRESRSERG